MPHHLILSLLILTVSELPAHNQNLAFRAGIDEGLSAGDAQVKLPEPTFADGQTAEQQHAALVAIVRSSRGADQMLQDSISAPHRLLTKDVKGDGVVIRSVDLYFVLRGVDLDAIKPQDAFRQLGGEPMEAANMRFETRLLKEADLPDSATSDHEWRIHATGRLLDRIAVETTDRVVASRSEDSLVFASRTDAKFGVEGKFPNRWSTITQKATGDVFGPPQVYAGGIGYVKMTRLKNPAGAIMVEAHMAFSEPLAWFDGAPILRSKFGLIAQDQVRRLRRELQKAKP